MNTLYQTRHPLYKTITLIMLWLIVAGCTTIGPNYAEPQMDIPSRWTEAQTTAPRSDLTKWWQDLHDSTLSSLVEEALRNSLDLRSARAKLREARARRDQAGANRFPTVTASISGSRVKSSAATGAGTTNELFDAGFDASWEPDVFGGQTHAVEANAAEVEASQADLHDAQVTLVAEVALNYVELRSYQARLAIARNNLAAQSEILQISEWRQQAGLATSLDVEQARTNSQQTRASIPSLNTSLVEAENRLAILLGKPPAALHDQLANPAPLPIVTEQVAAGIPADTLRQRPDVRAAERRLAAETARVGQETSALYPSFNLSGSFGWKALTLGALGSSGTAASSVLASITQTLFDAGRIRDSIKIQSAIQEQALINYEKTVLSALEDVENALASYANNREREEALQLAEQSARNAAQLAKQQYESGLIDFQKVLDSERTQLNVEDSLASTEADSLTSLISLYKALGGGWSEETAESETTNSKTHTLSERQQP